MKDHIYSLSEIGSPTNWLLTSGGDSRGKLVVLDIRRRCQRLGQHRWRSYNTKGRKRKNGQLVEEKNHPIPFNQSQNSATIPQNLLSINSITMETHRLK